MKYLSLFSGIGGFELGIQKAYEELHNIRPNELADSKRPKELHEFEDKLQQWECVGYSEIDKYAIQVYNKHFKHKNYGDCTKIITSELPDFDLLVGGFPCQAFSIAGKRRGFDEARGTLFFDIARILADKKPRNFILENVKGLLSHDGGHTFTTIIRILSTMGYFVEWQVLNAKNFGVPQNRERVFIVGHLGGIPRRKVFPITESNDSFIKVCARGKHQQDIVYNPEGILNLPAGTHGSTPHLTKIIDGGQAYRVYKKEGISPTISTPSGGNHIPQIDGMRIRRLTPKECERLMGYPDFWTLEGTEGKISDTQRYKMCGNGIVSNVVKEVVKRLLTQ